MKGRFTLFAAVAIGASVLLPGAAFATKIDRIDAGPTPPPPPSTDSASVILKDDFTSGDWGTGTDKDSSVEYDNGTLRAIVYKLNYFTWSTPDQTSYENVRMEATVLNNGTDPTTAFGFICDKDPNKHDFYYLAATATGEYAIAKAVDGQNDLFLTNNDKWGRSDLIAHEASSWRIAAECGNGRLALYVDGKEIASVTDSSYTKGQVALFAWSGEKATTTDIAFDDFVMSSLP